MNRIYSRIAVSSGYGVLALSLLLLAPLPASAQFMGHNFHGDFGVNSGSQPPPGTYVLVPFGRWSVDRIKDADGGKTLGRLFSGLDLRVMPPTMFVVTDLKLLGANYGAMVAPAWSKVTPELTIDTATTGSWGFSDLYVVPLHLGWHTSRADFVTGYGFFAPTGKFEAGGLDNVGLGMWSHELQLGTTLFLDEDRRFSAATTGFLEFHSKKKDQDISVGNLLTLEGGAAYNVPQIAGAFGVGYYLQQKLSDDTGSDVPGLALDLLNLRGKNRVFGIGPDVTIGLFQRGATGGLLNVRYFWEMGAQSSFEGQTLFVSVTLARFAG